MMKPHYETGYDLHVANYIAYGHTDKKLYEDEAHKTEVKTADAEKAFKLGRLLIQTADGMLVPLGMTSAGVVCYSGTGAVTYTTKA